MTEVKDNVISLFKLENELALNLRPFNPSQFINLRPSFRLDNAMNAKYVKPNFSEIEGRFKNKITPKIFLITAAGATGKSELTRYLSTKLSAPIFDLAVHTPVASNSLTGLFFETLGATGLAQFVRGLQNGENCMIIDALDEGYLKTTLDGFNSFLSEIAKLAKESTGTAFIILGRTQVLEHTWIYFEDLDIETSLLKLEPFTVDQAKEFIDKQIGEIKFDHHYQIVRDYIINSVEGFFKSDTEISKGGYNSFIGYAPVLLSISSLLKNSSNYIALDKQLRKDDSRGVDLIISIVQYIIKREKEEKIEKVYLPNILNDRSKEFKEAIIQRAYSPQEQCIRLLSYVSKQNCSYKICDDNRFQTLYAILR
jgi:hypothetical protein